jgi:hypothetical protein
MRKIMLTFMFFTLAAFSLIGTGCGKNDKKADQKSADVTQTMTPVLSNIGTVGGIGWNIPSGWTTGPANPMRVATYIINPIEGDKDNAECGVFFFEGGKGGGTVQANIDRWVGQMEQPDGKSSATVAKTSSFKANGLTITTVELSGIFSMTTGPMMQVKEKKPGYRLVAAIIDGPQGPIFFKMVGPDKTVIAAVKDFMILLNSAKIRGEV